MASLLVPFLTKNPVPQPSPAMFQYPPAGGNNPETSAPPSMINVIGLFAVAPASAALMRGPSSVAVPPPFLCPLFRLQSRAQPISDARIYVIPGTGTGAAAGPRQGKLISTPQLIKEPPKAVPAANRPDFTIKLRLSMRCAPELRSITTVCLFILKTNIRTSRCESTRVACLVLVEAKEIVARLNRYMELPKISSDTENSTATGGTRPKALFHGPDECLRQSSPAE